MGAEQRMVNKMDKDCTAVKLIYKNVSKNPDVAFEGTIKGNSYFFALEAKVYNIFNRSNYPKQLLSEILINRHSYSCGGFKNPTNSPITYGILLSYNNDKNGIHAFLKEHILNDDWISFGKLYNCKYVFLYDIIGNTLYYQDWNSFLVMLNPVAYSKPNG